MGVGGGWGGETNLIETVQNNLCCVAYTNVRELVQTNIFGMVQTN